MISKVTPKQSPNKAPSINSNAITKSSKCRDTNLAMPEDNTSADMKKRPGGSCEGERSAGEGGGAHS